MKVNISEENILRIKKLQIKLREKENQKDIVFDKDNFSKKEKNQNQKSYKCNIKYN